jgi:hypothetical protein
LPDERHIEQILGYLREHADEFPLSALRAQLAAQGYTPDAIEAALNRFAAQGQPATGATIALPPEANPIPTPADVPPSPAPGGEREAAIQALIGYIAQHRATYDLRALRNQLLAAGHPSAIVDEAIRRSDSSSAGRPTWLSRALAGCAAGLPVLLANYLVLAALAGGFGALSTNAAAWAFGIGAVVLLLGELIGGSILLGRGRTVLGQALVAGALYSIIAVPVALLLLALLVVMLVGICIAIISGVN